MSRRRAVLLYGLAAVAWALRLYRLGVPELWFDEAASYFIAAKPLAEIPTYVASAPFEHPPLYYVLLHGLMRLFGDSEWGLRFPSAMLGLLLVAGMWRATRTMFGEGLALVAAALAAVSPFLITYSQETRMYALVQCLGLLSTYLLWRAWRERRGALWAAYAATMLAGILTHYFFTFLLVTHALLALLASSRRRRLLLPLAAGGALLLVAIAAWIATAPGLRDALALMWRQSLWGKSPRAIAALFTDWAYGGAIIYSRPPWAWAPAAALALLPVLGAVAGEGISRRARGALVLWAVTPVACAIAIPYGGLALRHISYIVPALLLLTAAGVLALARRGLLPILAALLVVAAAYVPGVTWHYNLSKGDYGRAMAVVSAGFRQGDLVLLVNPHQWVLSRYYSRGGLPLGYIGAEAPYPGAQLEQARRIWALEWETWALPDAAEVRDSLRLLTAEAESRFYSNDLSLRLLIAKPAAAPTMAFADVAWDQSRQATAVRVWAGALAAGDAATVATSWAEARGVAAGSATILRMVDDSGWVWAERSTQPDLAADISGPADSWQALLVPDGTPPGRYHLQLALVDLATQGTLTASLGGVPVGPWLPLADVDVTGPTHPGVPAPPEATLGWLRFHGAEADMASVTAGARWRGLMRFSTATTPADATVRFTLTGAGGTVRLAEAPLASGSLAATQWQPGQVWRCPVEFRIPPGLTPGSYRVLVQPIAGAGRRLPWQPKAIEVAHFTVSARQIYSVAEQPSRPLAVDFAGQVRLYGYDLEPVDGALILRLYWQALGATAEAQKAFVHLAEVGVGEPVAQDDRAPSDVPTNDWLAGDAFVSEHKLPTVGVVSGHAYELRVGLYSERTMARLPASGDGAAPDHALIPLP